jgi:hypothetical protein
MASGLQVKDLNTPDQTLTPPNGVVQIVTFGAMAVGRATYQPGWRWSVDMQPIAGTDSCQTPHFGLVVSGRLHVRMDDGTEHELGPGSIASVAPVHDAWVVGNDPCVYVDWQGATRTS